MEISFSGGPLAGLGFLALLVFLFVPNRYLTAGHWGAALLLFALLEGSGSKGCCLSLSFWGALFGGAGLFAYWAYQRLCRKPESVPSTEASRPSNAASEQGHDGNS